MKNLIPEKIKQHWSKLLVFALLLVLLGSLITYKLPLPAALDLPRQMANGRDILNGNFDVLTKNVYSYTQPDHYFANHHWLYGVFAYVLQLVIGWKGIVVFKIILILFSFALLFKTATRKADFVLVAIASVPAIIMIAGRSDFRPELFGNFFTILYVAVLLGLEKKPNSKAIYWLLLAQVIWANTHITFPIGVMVAGGFLAEKILLQINKSFFTQFSFKKVVRLFKDTAVKRLIILCLALSVVSFINPLGIKGVVYSLQANIGSNSPVRSSEVQPISSTIDDLPKGASLPIALVNPILFLIALSFVFGYRRKLYFYFFACAGSGLLAFYVLRGGPFLGIFFLLAVPANFTPLFLEFKKWLVSRFDLREAFIFPFINVLIAIGLAVFTVTNYSNFLFGHEVGIGLERNSEDSAKFFLENNLKGPILNDTDIGSYLTYYLYPKEKIYSDNRFGDAYSDEFFKRDYADAVSGEARWEEVLEKYKFNVIFMYQYDQGYNMRDFMYRRIRDPKWVFVYGDRFSVILVRNIPENEEVIRKYAINIDNAQDRFKYMSEDYDGYNQVALADLYSLMGKADWAMANYAVAVAEHPEWAKIWFVMGKMELQRADGASNPALGLMYIQQAIDKGWKTTNSYSFLSLAYYRLGQLDKVEETIAKQLEINPDSDDAKTWISNLVRARAGKLEDLKR